MVETDINKRWENGIPHHPKSVDLYNKLEKYDMKFGGDYFRFHSGGDGDNGEHLMYLLDIIFEEGDNSTKKPEIGNVWREIELCLNDDEDGAGYLLDFFLSNRERLKDILLSANI